MIKLIATAESLSQGKLLIDAGVDILIVGESVFGLRIPGVFTWDEMSEMVTYAHNQGAQVAIASNAILHNDKIRQAREFLANAKATGCDMLTVGDTGLIQILKEPAYQLPYIYDASVLVVSPGQVNFWAKYGAIAAMVAREVPRFELEVMNDGVKIPLIYQVYGAHCIHQSGRDLLDNYFNYIGQEPRQYEQRHLTLSEPNKPETNYDIYQDSHGTHVFGKDDLNLLPYVDELNSMGVTHWYLDGIYCPGQSFVDVVKVFSQARQAIEQGAWSQAKIDALESELLVAHPSHRSLGTGFYLHEPGEVK